MEAPRIEIKKRGKFLKVLYKKKVVKKVLNQWRIRAAKKAFPSQ